MTSFGEVLTTARRASGKTQAELADAAGITQAALSRYENGLREPAPEVLEILARQLGVTPRFIEHAGKVRGAMAVDAHMRRRGTAQPTVWKRLEARLNMYRMHASLLSDYVHLNSDQKIPTFDPAFVAPDDAARMVRMQWQMPVGPVRGLTDWIEAAGCLVIEEDFSTSRVDGMSQWINGTPIIFINSTAPTDRKRLTLAHELGHLVLHSEDVTEVVEEEANDFAAELLMPLEVIRPQLKNLKADMLFDLKREWGVSMGALIERAFRADIITGSQRTSMWKMFSARGWRKQEPLSDRLAPEVPKLTARIASELEKTGLTSEEIAAISGLASPAENRLLPTRRSGLRSV